jgi:hypothetical protein
MSEHCSWWDFSRKSEGVMLPGNKIGFNHERHETHEKAGFNVNGRWFLTTKKRRDKGKDREKYILQEGTEETEVLPRKTRNTQKNLNR